MKWKVSTIALLVVVAAYCASLSPAAPQPSPVATAWQLDISVGTPKAFRFRPPGEEDERVFWYLPYEVVNHTGEDQLFVGQFALYTNTGELIRGGRRVPKSVFLAIKEMLNDPLLRDQTAMVGKILQGRDNARRGLAIFRDFSDKAGEFDIFVGGLSGESVTIPLPQPVDVDVPGKEEKVLKDSLTLTKTLRLRYVVSGNLEQRRNLSARELGRDWVMR